jgi:hypothetical protein
MTQSLYIYQRVSDCLSLLSDQPLRHIEEIFASIERVEAIASKPAHKIPVRRRNVVLRTTGEPLIESASVSAPKGADR